MSMLTVCITLLFFLRLGTCEKCENEVWKLCIDQENCRDCMEANACCNWCYDENYKERRCHVESNLTGCSSDKIEKNYHNNLKIPRDGNKDFPTNSTSTDIIQLKPQRFDIFLRKGIPVNISFSYKSQENYPLDLYYLGDLSVSMIENLDAFRDIAEDLPGNLTKLTKDYKLAYGSFLDKTAMPFYFTTPEGYNQPCLGRVKNCETGYLFKHRLSFTSDTKEFVNRTSSSKITANLDDLDGALDAILQILLCEHIVGWRKESRKIILLATDSLLHSAGDGLLAGAVKRPPDRCNLDKNGNHIAPLLYDYPSVGHIHRLLREKKVNILFAVKDSKKIEYYKKLTDELLKDSAFVGELDSKSGNILQLIGQGFYNFASQVGFSMNTSQANHFTVRYFGDCERTGHFNETSYCYNIGKGEYNFKVQITLNDYPSDSESDTLYIEEKNINEKITLNIKYRNKCKCENYESVTKTCKNGTFECGSCVCQNGWTGDQCEEQCEDKEYHLSCRHLTDEKDYEKICSGNGECYCAKCQCSSPYQGDYCQFKCPQDKYNKVCGGIDHGQCYQGKCICKSPYAGDDCLCSTLTTNCRLSNASDTCSASGKCFCNSCKCYPGFSGSYCEINSDNNNTLCEMYKDIFEDGNMTETDTDDISVRMVRDLGNKEAACETVVFQGASRCRVSYNYHARDDGKTQIEAMKNCSQKAGIGIIALSIVAAFLIPGIIGILLYKLHLHRTNLAEVKRFNAEKKAPTQSNPLYKSPWTHFENPMQTSN